MKIVINSSCGRFSISRKAAKFMAKNGCERAKAELEQNPHDGADDWSWGGYGYVNGLDDGYDRTSEHLILAVETLGSKANGKYASLKVLEIPDDVDWYIFEDEDGSESIHERHRTWR